MGLLYRVVRVSDGAVICGPADASNATDITIDVPDTGAGSQTYQLQFLAGQTVITPSAGDVLAKAVFIGMSVKR